MKILISDSSSAQASSIESLILAECPTCETVIRIEDFSDSVSWAVLNNVDIICRAVPGISQADRDLSDYALANLIGVVFAHGGNDHTEIDRPYLGSACAVGCGTATANTGSYGNDIDFYVNTATQQNAAAIASGVIGQLLIDNPTWNFLGSRHALRQTASNYSTGWVVDGGYGLIDKSLAGALGISKTVSPPLNIFHRSGWGEVTVSWSNYVQENFSNTYISKFDSKPSLTSVPLDGVVLYSGTGQDYTYKATDSGTIWIGIYSSDTNGNYSLQYISPSFKFGGSIDRLGVSRNSILSIKDYIEGAIESYGYGLTFVSSWGEDHTIVTPADYDAAADKSELTRIPACSINIGTRQTGKPAQIGSSDTIQALFGNIFIYAESEGQIYDLIDIILQNFENSRGTYIYDFSSTGYPSDDAPRWFYMTFTNADARPFINLGERNAAMKFAGIINFTGQFIREV